MKGVQHYTEDGEYKGATHKMSGKTHTGKSHTKSSKVISHKKDGPFKMKTPLRCWTKAGYIRKPGTTKGSKGSCYKPGKK